jgi:hypothetical protein
VKPWLLLFLATSFGAGMGMVAFLLIILHLKGVV